MSGDLFDRAHDARRSADLEFEDAQYAAAVTQPLSPTEAAIVERFELGEPAPESWRGDDGLRDDMIAALRARNVWERAAEVYVDALLPVVTAWHADEVAALRAKAAAADRVRDALNSHRGCDVETIASALDGPPC